MIDSISLNITQDFSFLTFEEKEFPSRKITSILRGNKKKTTEKNEPEIGKLIKKFEGERKYRLQKLYSHNVQGGRYKVHSVLGDELTLEC